ncbi:hypothetical protein [Kineosporia sp. A_224]|uniref:hypothetical protein n=1 Tax=Kineosporia sp. A_224 TaxID=1962180 RepID=UPI000B4B89EB|nr:hypothetical protein [Kineosporia sp. A_224]
MAKKPERGKKMVINQGPDAGKEVVVHDVRPKPFWGHSAEVVTKNGRHMRVDDDKLSPTEDKKGKNG